MLSDRNEEYCVPDLGAKPINNLENAELSSSVLLNKTAEENTCLKFWKDKPDKKSFPYNGVSLVLRIVGSSS
jgi:hypothetical protein